MLYRKERQDQSDVFYYYHYDGNGNVTSITEDDGDEVAIYEYDGFGNVITEAGSLANEFKFSTKQADKRGQLIDFGFRWYEPEIGRWTQRDPIGMAGGPNLYAYCNGNPMNFGDPWGLQAIKFPPSQWPGGGRGSAGPGQRPTEGGGQNGESARDEQETAHPSGPWNVREDLPTDVPINLPKDDKPPWWWDGDMADLLWDKLKTELVSVPTQAPDLFEDDRPDAPHHPGPFDIDFGETGLSLISRTPLVVQHINTATLSPTCRVVDCH